MEREPVPAISPMADSIYFTLAVYYLPLPSRDPVETLQRLINSGNWNFRVGKMVESPREMMVEGILENDVLNTFAPPDPEDLRYWGRGVSDDQARELQKSKQVFILLFEHPREKVWQGLRQAYELVECIARETGGLVWDDETREMYSPDEWREQRLDSWTEDVPDVSKHTFIHSYKKTEYVRAITLGMAKFGLPDVVINDFPTSYGKSIGSLMNLFCQAMAEGSVFTKKGEFDLVLNSIRNKDMREANVETLKANPDAIAFLSLMMGVSEEGDPNNPLIEITFDRYSGNGIQERQLAMITSFFGTKDSHIYIRHPPEVIKASESAKKLLPTLQNAFSEGLQPGEYLLVKAPFAIPSGGKEYMWVEVTQWTKGKIRGVLKNEPIHRPDLRAGQVVEVNQSDVFDYLCRFPDGTEEGNETGKIIQKMQEKSGRK